MNRPARQLCLFVKPLGGRPLELPLPLLRVIDSLPREKPFDYHMLVGHAEHFDPSIEPRLIYDNRLRARLRRWAIGRILAQVEPGRRGVDAATYIRGPRFAAALQFAIGRAAQHVRPVSPSLPPVEQAWRELRASLDNPQEKVYA